jgi:hypothetical protein
MRHPAGAERTSANADSRNLTRSPRTGSICRPHIAPAVSQLPPAPHARQRHPSHCLAEPAYPWNALGPRPAYPGLPTRHVLAGSRSRRPLRRGNHPWVTGRRRRLRECQPSASARNCVHLARSELRQTPHRRCGPKGNPYRSPSEWHFDYPRARAPGTIRTSRLSFVASRRVDLAMNS